jgi:glutathione S-transferase
MLNLYIKTGCPYCLRVISANESIGAPLNLRNISDDAGLRAELLEKGGKTQAPYLEDTDRGVSMYESLEIIDYLSEHYGNGQPVETAIVGNVCPID